MPTDVETGEGLTRIRIRLERAEDEPGPREDSIWAEPLGSDRYRVESCPFFAYGVSRDDVIRAPPAPGEGTPVLEAVLEKSGHRTLRLAMDASLDLRSPAAQRLLGRLVEVGCTHELLRPKLVAVDVPAESDLAVVAEVLQEAARAGALVWEWADPRPS